jgi:hypothetical protein
VYALTLLGQVTYWNAFGFDRSAAQFYFSAPVPLGRVLAGKNIAAALFIFLEIAAVAAACSLVRLGISPARIAEAFLVTGVAALYLLGIGNLSSVNYPRAMSHSRVGSGGATGRAQGVLFLFYPVARSLWPTWHATLLEARRPSTACWHAQQAWERPSIGCPWNRQSPLDAAAGRPSWLSYRGVKVPWWLNKQQSFRRLMQEPANATPGGPNGHRV